MTGISSHNKIQWTNEQLEAIRLDTRSSYDIADIYGVSANTIQQLRKDSGIHVLPGNTGKTHSDETRAKISEAVAGKLAGELNGFYGKSHSSEANEKNRLAHLGKCKFTPEQIQEMKVRVSSGETLSAIATSFNCSGPTIKRMLLK